MLIAGRELPVAGLTPLTTVDWPDQLAAVIFTRGCPWRCPYCHNPDLQRIEGEGYDWAKVLGFLNTRRGLLDGVVFSGGEPLVHDCLATAMAEVRALGFSTALHTAGAHPDRFEELLSSGLVDWVGFDVKAPFKEYQAITGRPDSGGRARASLEALVASGIAYELRTTVYGPLKERASLERLGADLSDLRAGNLVLQACRTQPDYPSPDGPLLTRLASTLQPVLGPVDVRA